MQSISARFAATLPYTYQLANLAVVWGQSGGSYQQLLPAAGNVISMLSGSVTVDTTQAVRRTLTLTLADPQGWLVPQCTPTGAMSPFGGEVQVSTGITYPDGTRELIPLGIFAMTSVVPTLGPSGDLTIAVQGSDRSYTVGLRALKQPVSVATGQSVSQGIQTLIGNLMPNGARLFIAASASSVTMEATTFNMGDNPWQDAVGIANNAGYQLYFDVNGDCQCQPMPNPPTLKPVWNFVYGQGSMVTSVSRNLTQVGPDGPISNDIIVVYEGTGTAISDNPPIQAEYEDTNPQSATYVSGPYGDVPSFVYSTVAQGQAAAQAAAQQQLYQNLGQADGLTLTTLPAPMLDGYDVVTCTFPKLSVGGNYIVQAVTIPIGVGGTGSLTVNKVVTG